MADPSVAGAAARTAQIRAQLAELDAVELRTLDEQVDAEVLRTALAAELLDLDVIREAEWNPMLHNPGAALHSLLSRPFAPLADRLTAVAQRLRAVPACLAAARGRLTEMSRCHLETALTEPSAAGRSSKGGRSTPRS